MPITLTCPSCGKQCAVKDEYAGMQVRCPNCPAVITAPPPAPPVIAAEPYVTTPVPEYASEFAPPPPPPPRVPSGPSFIDKVTKFLAANGVNQINFILLLVGMGCMAIFLITVLLPWVSISFGNMRVSRLGIQIGTGIVQFLLVLGTLFLLVFVILMEWRTLLNYALWTSSNLCIFIVLHLLAVMGEGAGIGLILALIVMLVAAGTLGVVAFSRVFGKAPVA